MQEFKIIFKDGRTRLVPADSYEVRGDFFVFLQQRKDILSVATSEVESVGLADLPPATKPQRDLGPTIG